MQETIGNRLPVVISGTSAFIMDIWGNESGPYNNCLHFLVMMGATIAPQIVKPFLAHEMIDYPFNSTSEALVLRNNISASGFNDSSKYAYQTNTSLFNPYPDVKDSQFLPNIDNALDGPIAGDVLELTRNEQVNSGTKVQFAYVIIGIGMIIGSSLHMVLFLLSKCNTKHIENNGSSTKKEEKVMKTVNNMTNLQGKSFRYKTFSSLLLIVLCILAFMVGGLEEIFGGFLVTFSVKKLEWSKESATDLPTIFWASIAMIRLIAIFLSKLISAKILIGASISLLTLSVVTMSFTVLQFSSAILIGTIVLGLGIGSLFSTIINLSKTSLPSLSSGFISSALFVTLFVAKIGTPVLIGYLFENVDYMWFLHLSLVYVCMLIFNYVLLLLTSFYHRKSL